MVKEERILNLLKGYEENGEWIKLEATYIIALCFNSYDDALKCLILRYGEQGKEALNRVTADLALVGVEHWPFGGLYGGIWYGKTEDTNKDIKGVIMEAFTEKCNLTWYKEEAKKRIARMSDKARKALALLIKLGFAIKHRQLTWQDVPIADIKNAYKGLFNEEWVDEIENELISSMTINAYSRSSRHHTYWYWVAPPYTLEVLKEMREEFEKLVTSKS